MVWILPLSLKVSIMKRSLLLLCLALFSAPLIFAQLDSALLELAIRTAKRIDQKKIKTVAVWGLMDRSRKESALGDHLAEDLSIHLTNAAQGFQVMDRMHLEQILEEHKLNMQGFIDPSTTKEIGKWLAVDAIVTGTIAILGDEIKVRIKVLDTETALQIVAEMALLPFEKDLRILLQEPGSVFLATSGTLDDEGHPIDPRVHYSDQKNKSPCRRSTGDIAFANLSTQEVIVNVVKKRKSYRIAVQPGSIEFLYNLKKGSWSYGLYHKDDPIFVGTKSARVQGQFLVQTCRSKTYVYR